MFSNETLEPYVEAAKVRQLTDFTKEKQICRVWTDRKELILNSVWGPICPHGNNERVMQEPTSICGGCEFLDKGTHEEMVCGKKFLKTSPDTYSHGTCRGEPLHAKFPDQCLQCKRFVP